MQYPKRRTRFLCLTCPIASTSALNSFSAWPLQKMGKLLVLRVLLFIYLSHHCSFQNDATLRPLNKVFIKVKIKLWYNRSTNDVMHTLIYDLSHLYSFKNNVGFTTFKKVVMKSYEYFNTTMHTLLIITSSN